MRQRWFVIPGLLYGLFLGVMDSHQAIAAERATTGPSPTATSVRDSKIATSERISVAGESKAGRIREGSRIVDQIGEFQKSGEQVNFFANEGIGTLRVLENLALERVVRALDDNPNQRVWSVSGVITEFRGENYLLVTRAILKAQPKSGPAAVQRKAESVDKNDE